MNHAPDRWKCPDCGTITVDPCGPIVRCACGSERVQMREFPRGDDWTQPDWPEDSDYNGDPHDVETDIEFENAKYPGYRD